VADPAVAYHAAQDAALRGSTEFAALFPGGVARIYTVVPQNAPLPFARIGDDQILEDSDECIDASEIVSQVHIWTNPDPPDVQLGRRMAGLVRELLVGLTIPGFDVVLAQFTDTRHLTDPDGSSHAVLGFRYFVTDRPEVP